MRKAIIGILFLLLAPALTAQSVTLPAEIKGSVGAWIIVAPEKIDGGAPRWRIDPGLQEVRLDLLLPPEMITKLKGKVVTAGKPGRYKVEVWNAKGDAASEISICWVVIDGAKPEPGPKPDPDPPQPSDGPFAGAPGLHVLIVYESSKNLSIGHHSIIYGKKFRDYLVEKCARTANGAPQRRIYDKDTPMDGESKLWQDAMKRNRTSLPWIAVGNGANWFEGPLPAGDEEAMALLKKIAS